MLRSGPWHGSPHRRHRAARQSSTWRALGSPLRLLRPLQAAVRPSLVASASQNGFMSVAELLIPTGRADGASARQVQRDQSYVSHMEIPRILTPSEPGMQGAPIMAGSIMAMAYLFVAGRGTQDARSGLLLEMAGGHPSHVPSAYPSSSSGVLTPTRQHNTSSNGNGHHSGSGNGSSTFNFQGVPANKEAELSAALQVANDLELQVAKLAEDVKEREQQLNGLQESAKAQTAITKGALRESQRKVQLLEAMVRALRERLSSEEARTVALSAEVAAGQEALGVANAARQQAESRVVELRQEVTTAMAMLEKAESRARLLEQRVAELTTTTSQLQSRVLELEHELSVQAQAAAQAARQAELRIQHIQQSATHEAQAAEALRAQLAARDRELREARAKLEELEKSRLDAAAQADGSLSSEASGMAAAVEEAMTLVQAREREVAELRSALEQAAAQVEAVSASKAEELASVRHGLESALAAAKQEVETSNQQLTQMRQEVEAVLNADLETLLSGSPPPSNPAALSSTAWQAAKAAADMRQLTNRQFQLSQEIRARSQALEEQAQQVYPQLSGQLATRATSLRACHAELLSTLQQAEARWEEDGAGMQAIARLKREINSVAGELAALLRAAMTPQQRAQERALRSELADRETELKGVTAQIMKLRQQYPPVPATEAGVAAAGNAAQMLQNVSASGQLPLALAKRLRELLEQREAEAAAAARAREADLERVSREREKAVLKAAQEREQGQVAQMRALEQAMTAKQHEALEQRKAEMAALEAQYKAQLEAARVELANKVKEAEVVWNEQLQSAQQRTQVAESDKQRLAAELTLGAVQARLQLSELAAVREELALRSRQLVDVRNLYEASKAAVERRAAGAAAEAALVAGQVAVLQKALQAREIEVNRLKALEQQQLEQLSQAEQSDQAGASVPGELSDWSDEESEGAGTRDGSVAARSVAPAASPTADARAAFPPELAAGRALFMPQAAAPPSTAQPAPASQPPSTTRVPTNKDLSSVGAYLEATRTNAPAAPVQPSSAPATAAKSEEQIADSGASASAQQAGAALEATMARTPPPSAAQQISRRPVWTDDAPSSSDTALPPVPSSASAAKAEAATPTKSAQAEAASTSAPEASASSVTTPAVKSADTPTGASSAATAQTATATQAAQPITTDTAAAATAGTTVSIPAAPSAAAPAETSTKASGSASSAASKAAPEATPAPKATISDQQVATTSSTAAAPPAPTPSKPAAAASTSAAPSVKMPTPAPRKPTPDAKPSSASTSTRPMPPVLPSSQWGQPKTPDASAAAATTAAPSTSQPAASTPAAAASSSAPPASPSKPASIFPDLEDLGAEITRITQALVGKQSDLWSGGSNASSSTATSTPAQPPSTTSQPRAPTPQAQPEATTSRPATTPSGSRRAPASVTRQLQLITAGYMMPHSAKVERGGEDAFFVSTTGIQALGVTDGVGGWAVDGVDVAAYARGICEKTAEALQTTRGTLGAHEALEQAQDTVKLPGSCTACVAVLREDKRLLEVANLGDSGMRLLRGGRVVGATAVQEHAFNMPYQLADPESFPETDLASDAQVYSFPVQDGDVVVMATDGLWDNLWDEQIMSIVSQTLPPEGVAPTTNTASLIASRLTKAAHIAARDPNAKTPWAVESATASGNVLARLFPRGGKMDDITVVAAVVHLGGSGQ